VTGGEARAARERAEKPAEMFQRWPAVASAQQWNEEEVDESEAIDDEFFRMLD